MIKLPEPVSLSAKDFDKLTSELPTKDITGFPVFSREGDPSKLWPIPEERYANFFPEFFAQKVGD